MIHQLLNLQRHIFVLDTETTGVDPETSRIVEIGFQQWMPSEGMTREWRSYINPGVPIPPRTTAVHGIDASRLARCNDCDKDRDGCQCERFKPIPKFKDIAESLARGFSDCDFAGQSVRFDLRMLAKEFMRSGIEWSYAEARVVDSHMLEVLLYPRDLGSLHEKYAGAKHDGAHGAMSDVRAAATVIAFQLDGHPERLPRDLDALHALQWPGWLVADGSFRMIDNVATITFGKHKNKAMQDVPTDYYDWLLREKFPPDVKRLAAEAKLGRFPGA